MIRQYLTVGLALALVAVTATAGVFAWRFERQSSALDSALASNALLSAALDRVVKQAKIDEAAVTNFNRQTAEIRATLDQQQSTLRELANDPESQEYLNRRVPDSVRELFENRQR